MSKRKFAKYGLATALTGLYGAAAVHAKVNPRPDSPAPHRLAGVGAALAAVTWLIAAL